ncbi:hypothetical protein AQUCO_00300711v1 [Aquilegia coerulea]|uniref:Sodium/calcium exchanger membrane region domain-containing protein n=1 Tax=Aquilegia coerulea TaxID=218851 RepID=A0A2G5F052_AQUCA|nr:hypothetical protein AQUCO_00300711v1 [Aquilegia coerulea]
MHNAESILGSSGTYGYEKCESYFLFQGEMALGNGLRAFLYLLGLAYCFFGLSAITARFFRSMENVVKQTRKVVEIDHNTNTEVIRHEKVWNYAIADITLLAFGTSFPQISLATIDAIRNLGQIYAGGLGPGTLVGSAAFDLFPIHAVCVVVPKAGELKKISDIGVWLVELFWSFWAYIWLYIILEVWTPNVVTLWEALITVLQFGLLLIHTYAQDKRWPYLSLPLARTERPEDWVPVEASLDKLDNNDYSEILQLSEEDNIVDIFSIHSEKETVGESRIKETGQHILKAGERYLASNSCTMESSVCFCASMSYCSWMDCFHLLFNIHQWNSLHCYKAHRYDKLCHRNQWLCHSIYSFGEWNIVAGFGCKQDCR